MNQNEISANFRTKHILKVLAIILLLLLPFFGWVQHSIIPTGTILDIQQLEVKDGHVFANSSQGYLSTCTGDCDDLVSLSCPNVAPFYYQSFLNVIDSNELFVTSFRGLNHPGYIYRSSDGGTSWNEILDTTNLFFQRLLVFDTSNISLVNSWYNSIYTSNGGNNWTSSSHSQIVITAATVVNDSTAFIAEPSGMQITTNRGITWGGLGGGAYGEVKDVFAFSPDSIIAVSTANSGNEFSYNFSWGNVMWTNEFLNYKPYALCVKSVDEVYVVGSRFYSNEWSKTIAKTTDLGQTWSFYDVGEPGVLRDMVLINDSTAIVAGDNGFMAR